MTRRQSRAAGSLSALFLPAGYRVVRTLMWGQVRAECDGWTGGLRDSRAAAVLDAWRHRRARKDGAPRARYRGPERRKPKPPVMRGTIWVSEDEPL